MGTFGVLGNAYLAPRYVVIHKVSIFSKVDVIDSCQMFLSTYQ